MVYIEHLLFFWFDINTHYTYIPRPIFIKTKKLNMQVQLLNGCCDAKVQGRSKDT